jgi:hypothetical protein
MTRSARARPPPSNRGRHLTLPQGVYARLDLGTPPSCNAAEHSRLLCPRCLDCFDLCTVRPTGPTGRALPLRSTVARASVQMPLEHRGLRLNAGLAIQGYRRRAPVICISDAASRILHTGVCQFIWREEKMPTMRHVGQSAGKLCTVGVAAYRVLGTVAPRGEHRTDRGEPTSPR